MKLPKHILSVVLILLIILGPSTKVFAASEPLVNQIAIVNATSLRLRSGPTTGHPTIDTAPKGDYVMILDDLGSWYRVRYNLREGYMHKSYLTTYSAKNTELGYGVVSGTNVNLRTGPGTSYKALTRAQVNDRAYVIGYNRQWYKVIYKDNICYIRSDYLRLTQIPYENKASANKPLFFVNGVSTGLSPSGQALKEPTAGTLRQKVTAEANKYLGIPYVWGGSTPSGFDCSGFTQYVLKQCGISIPRTTTEQYSVGSYLPKNDLRPGDLVFLKNTYRDGISHVGIYIGNNQMIHASSSKGVTISDLTTSYYVQHYHGSRQIISE